MSTYGIDKDLIEATAKLDDLSRNTSNLERTRTRLSTEIEDLKLKIVKAAVFLI